MRCFVLSLFMLAACAADELSESDQALISEDSACVEEAAELDEIDEIDTFELEALAPPVDPARCTCKAHCDKGPKNIPTCRPGYSVTSNDCPTSCTCEKIRPQQ